MSKREIQTDLVDQTVKVNSDLKVVGSNDYHEAAGKLGLIRSVYFDKEGEIKYTVLIVITGKLYEMYSNAFLI